MKEINYITIVFIIKICFNTFLVEDIIELTQSTYTISDLKFFRFLPEKPYVKTRAQLDAILVEWTAKAMLDRTRAKRTDQFISQQYSDGFNISKKKNTKIDLDNKLKIMEEEANLEENDEDFEDDDEDISEDDSTPKSSESSFEKENNSYESEVTFLLLSHSHPFGSLPSSSDLFLLHYFLSPFPPPTPPQPPPPPLPPPPHPPPSFSLFLLII